MCKKQVFHASPSAWIVFSASLLLLIFSYKGGLTELMRVLNESEEYSHGILIPFIALFLVWQKKNDLSPVEFSGSWVGLFFLLSGVGLFYLGELSALYIIVQYAFLVALYGLVLSWVGWKGIRILWAPLLVLAFMIPLPAFLYNNLSAQLQLVSSELGVWVIRLLGISVYLQGNVIDLGTYKLQVVEACSGLRYLFPLMTLGFIVAYIYDAPMWKRILVFLSTIPITVLMNSFRIGVIGIMVEYWGPSMAEGFLHDFEGWIVFMACLGVLLVEMWVLSYIGADKKPLSHAFSIELPEPAADDIVVTRRKTPATLYVSLIVTALAVWLSATVEERVELYPERLAFSQFPLELDDWSGKRDALESIYVDTLKFDDYLLADYVNAEGVAVNFYIAYYASQRKGESAHSPRSCLPGSGWKIVDFSQRQIDVPDSRGMPLVVNRAEIRKGEYTQLVYYWFQGRSRIITNEYMVKWYLFWDSMSKHRSDGALVRVTTLVAPGEDMQVAETRLTEFAIKASGMLDGYIPR